MSHRRKVSSLNPFCLLPSKPPSFPAFLFVTESSATLPVFRLLVQPRCGAVDVLF